MQTFPYGFINSDGIIIKSDPTAKEVEKHLQKVLCATM